MISHTGHKTRDLGPHCELCRIAPVQFPGEWCRGCDTRPKRVATNLRKLIPWIIGAALIFMGIKMAFATFVSMN